MRVWTVLDRQCSRFFDYRISLSRVKDNGDKVVIQTLARNSAGQYCQTDLREFISAHGCYSRQENEDIYDRWFAKAPRYLFRAVDKKYGISRKILCDVGCSYGMNLLSCSPGSYGIEIEHHEVHFANRLGLTVYERDIINDEICDLPKVDAVWCSAILEHVDSPHILLRKLHQLLKPQGLMAVYVPTLPLISTLKQLPVVGKYFIGHTASDHINAFVPSTLRFFCERAGFKTIEVSPFYPGPLGLFNHLPLANQLVDGCLYIGESIQDWEYPRKATRRATISKKGFEFIGQQLINIRDSQ
jgi:2-polyprenyl-3-methyl-5-hydroxy-6-metoxy-1,4-benzoquinol methylase